MSNWRTDPNIPEKVKEKMREDDRKYQRKKRKEKSDLKKKENYLYRLNKKVESKAHSLLNQKINAGLIKRGKCLLCERTDTHAHHFDYSKPYEVVWLCPSHHKRLHMGTLKEQEIKKLRKVWK